MFTLLHFDWWPVGNGKNVYNQQMNWSESVLLCLGKNPIMPIISPCWRTSKGLRLASPHDRFASHYFVPVWVKSDCIWSNLRDCWTVNTLQPWTAVLPWVKCDEREGEHGGHMEMTEAYKENKKNKSGSLVSVTPNYTKASCLSVDISHKLLNKSGKFSASFSRLELITAEQGELS